MALPDARITVEDGALGTLPPNVAGASVKIGVCSKGVPNSFKGYSDIKAMREELGQGPLVEAIAQVLNVAGGPVYAVPATPSVAGAVGSVTHEGPGTGTVTPSLGPDRTIVAKVITPGALGTMTVSFNVDGKGFGNPITSSASAPWDVRVPGTLVSLRFPAGTYVVNETYTATLKGAMEHRNNAGGGAGTGTGPAASRQTTSPVDAYDVLVDIVTDGGLGAGAFIYSLDGGNNVSPAIAIPADGVYAIPGAGLILTFAGTFTKGDEYAFTTTAAGFSSSDVNAAMDAALVLPTEWGFVHVVGLPANAAAAAVIATGLDVKLMGAETGFRYAFGIAECPMHEGDAAAMTAFQSFASTRVMVCVGDAGIVSPLTGRVDRRNIAWVVAARIALIPIGEDPAWVGRGRLPGVVSLYRDEAKTPGLDEARFTTLRTHLGLPGYYVTNGRMMAPGGSDFTYVQHRRVMDRACQVTRAAELPYLNQDVDVDDATGFIQERAAQQFEADVGGQLRDAMVAAGHASGATVVLSRNVNLLSGVDQPVTVRVIPKAYLKHLDTSIGFSNPALAAAA